MFEKEAEEYSVGKAHEHYNYLFEEHAGSPVDFARWCFQDGAEYGYNKANEWHYVKDKLPIKTDSTLCELMPVFVAVKVGYKVETYGTYWNLKTGKFECLDEVYAWCYTPDPPELPKEIGNDFD